MPNSLSNSGNPKGLWDGSRLDKSRKSGKVMRYSFLVEPVEEREKMPGWFYAHVPSLGVTTHGQGIEGALDAARDLIHLWVDRSILRQAGLTEDEFRDMERRSVTHKVTR